MSTNPTPDPNASENQDGNKPTGGSTSDAGGDAFKPITSQDELNRIVGDRVKREQAKFSDYDDVKAKAARLDELEAANKSELEKEQEARTAAEAARDKAVADGLRWKIAAKHGISDEDAELFLTGRDEQTLEAQAKRLADREADRKKQGNRAPTEGRAPTTTSTDLQQFTRGLFGKT